MHCGTRGTQSHRCGCCGRTPAMWAGRTRRPIAGSCSTGPKWATSGGNPPSARGPGVPALSWLLRERGSASGGLGPLICKMGIIQAFRNNCLALGHDTRPRTGGGARPCRELLRGQGQRRGETWGSLDSEKAGPVWVVWAQGSGGSGLCTQQ